jgi:hypothetical protein
MNYRLLTQEQKRCNRRERFRRNRCQKASRRREAALLQLRDPVLLRSPFVSALTCTELLNQPRVAAVRGLVRRLNRIDTTLPDLEQTAGAGQNIPRPRRTLWMRNRGIVPELVRQPVINIQEFLGAEKALQHARDLLSTHDPAQILDLLTTPNAIGLAPSGCAELAWQVGLTFDAAVIQKVQEVREFNTRLVAAQTMYLAMTAASQLKTAKGTWAFFDSAALHATLAGLHLPHVLQRCAFLVRLRYRNGLLVCLDLHGLSYFPLCRHPIGSNSGKFLPG